MLIADVERQVEEIYDRYSFPPQIADYLEDWLRKNIEAEQDKYAAGLTAWQMTI